MSDTVLTAIIVAIPPTLVALVAAIKSFRNGAAVEKVHIAINSRMDEMLKLTRTSSHAEGVLEEKKNPTP